MVKRWKLRFLFSFVTRLALSRYFCFICYDSYYSEISVSFATGLEYKPSRKWFLVVLSISVRISHHIFMATKLHFHLLPNLLKTLDVLLVFVIPLAVLLVFRTMADTFWTGWIVLGEVLIPPKRLKTFGLSSGVSPYKVSIKL